MWGTGQTNKVIKYGEGAQESLLFMGPERPRYATVCKSCDWTPHIHV